MEEGGEDEEEAGNGMVGPGCQWDRWGSGGARSGGTCVGVCVGGGVVGPARH